MSPISVLMRCIVEPFISGKPRSRTIIVVFFQLICCFSALPTAVVSTSQPISSLMLCCAMASSDGNGFNPAVRFDAAKARSLVWSGRLVFERHRAHLQRCRFSDRNDVNRDVACALGCAQTVEYSIRPYRVTHKVIAVGVLAGEEPASRVATMGESLRAISIMIWRNSNRLR
jgi:hypothetical protein